MRPYDGVIDVWEVGAAVGNVRNNQPELMERVGLMQAKLCVLRRCRRDQGSSKLTNFPHRALGPGTCDLSLGDHAGHPVMYPSGMEHQAPNCGVLHSKCRASCFFGSVPPILGALQIVELDRNFGDSICLEVSRDASVLFPELHIHPTSREPS
jgi:hypothetical protein